MKKLTDKVADATSRWLGSTSYFFLFTGLTIVWTTLGVTGVDAQFAAFTVFLSILAIYMTIFIERSTTTLNDTLLEHIKKTEKKSEEDLKTTQRLERKIDKYGRSR